MSNMNLLCFNLDSCTQSHPFSLEPSKSKYVSKPFELGITNSNKLQEKQK